MPPSARINRTRIQAARRTPPRRQDETEELSAAARFYHHGRLLTVDEHFWATPTEATDLIALHFAVRAPSAPAPRIYERRDMAPEE